MREILILTVHLLAKFAKLLRPGFVTRRSRRISSA